MPRGGQWKVRFPGPEVANFSAHAELTPHLHIQSEAALNYTRGRGLPGILSSIDQRRSLAEMAEADTKAYPWGPHRSRKQVQPGPRVPEHLAVRRGPTRNPIVST